MNLRAARRPAIAIATAAALALGAGACSKDQAQNTPSSSVAANSTAADGEKVTAPKSRIAFIAPKGWQAVDIGKAASAPADQLPENFKKFAEQQGKSPEELLKSIGQADVMVMTPTPANGFSDNINVVPAVGLSALPSEDEARSQFEGMGATVTKVEKVQIPGGGSALVSHYQLPVGNLTVQGRSIIYVHSADHAGIISISMSDNAKADEVLAQVLGSLTAS